MEETPAVPPTDCKGDKRMNQELLEEMKATAHRLTELIENMPDGIPEEIA